MVLWLWWRELRREKSWHRLSWIWKTYIDTNNVETTEFAKREFLYTSRSCYYRTVWLHLFKLSEICSRCDFKLNSKREYEKDGRSSIDKKFVDETRKASAGVKSHREVRRTCCLKILIPFFSHIKCLWKFSDSFCVLCVFLIRICLQIENFCFEFWKNFFFFFINNLLKYHKSKALMISYFTRIRFKIELWYLTTDCA